ncbi:type 1 glutamine amidotransferase [Solicola gregarius]|uniref:Gamma-glutamyl-gamma-aminobutyrate hydrolase family protein n=1 Tax=Solicola gregarius TaxID=2908642 RepID=A0AA46TFX5_9ACTN|nr:gamma-glutamyl-gamma-aminobutyrate hydrolase family protein [Solicola gregarius]UYM04627.1 gamma-glutamyl-gamma-aminobutyrate hydrolase family protein [Solicola gregarius]
MRVYVSADADDRQAGFVGGRLVERGAELRYLDRDALPTYAGLDAPDLLVLLGSARSAWADDQRDVVASEAALVRDALDAGTPAMGICYGGQLIARALGGTVQRAETAEFGWRDVASIDPELCPVGPWAQFHGDSFKPAPTSRVIGTSAAGCQGFVDESLQARAIGWQFHPEVSGTRFSEWVDELEGFCVERGGDPDALRREAVAYADTGRLRAHDLTDAALAWLMM